MEKAETEEKKTKKEEQTKKEGKNKKTVIIAGVCVLVVVIIAIIIFNVATVKTLKCSHDADFGQGVVQTVDNIEKFRFGEPISFYSKQVYDFSKFEADDEQKEERISLYEEGPKENCKKENGCKYTVKRDGDKLTIVYKTKHTKEGRKAFWDKYSELAGEDITYDEYVEIFEGICETYNNR